MVCPPLQQMMNRPFWFAVLWTWDAPLYGDWIAIWTWGVDQKKMIKIGGKVEVVPPVYMAMAHGNFCWVTSVQLFDKSPCLLTNRVEAMKTKGREMTWNMRNLNKVERERTIQIDNWQYQHDFGSWTFGSIVYVDICGTFQQCCTLDSVKSPTFHPQKENADSVHCGLNTPQIFDFWRSVWPVSPTIFGSCSKIKGIKSYDVNGFSIFGVSLTA